MIQVSQTTFICDRCGKEISYPTDEYNYEADGCWSIHLGRAGYGSSFDGSDVNFDICDDCLYEFVNTFKHKDRVFNSGSNTYYEVDTDLDNYGEGDED